MTTTGDAEVKLSERLEDAAEHWDSLNIATLLRDAAELARSVEDADSMQVLTGPRGFGEIVCMPSHIGKRVRLVPEDGQGGGA